MHACVCCLIAALLLILCNQGIVLCNQEACDDLLYKKLLCLLWLCPFARSLHVVVKGEKAKVLNS